MTRSICCFIALMVMLPGTVAAQTKIFAYQIHGRLEPGKDLAYNRFLDAAMGVQGGGHEVFIQPPARAKTNFNRNENSCVFPSNLHYARQNTPEWKGYDLIGSSPVDRLTAHLFVRKGQPVPSSDADLDGKVVAYTRGFSFVTAHGTPTTRFVEIAGSRHYLRMLEEKRVDMVLGWIPGIHNTSKELGLESPDYDPEWVIAASVTQFVCKNTIANRQFLERFETVLKTLKMDGSLPDLFEDWASPVM